MKICETHGDWIVTAERAGTISGQHLSLGTQWTIEPQPDGEYRLTVCPDDTTYAWLMFQTRQEAHHWVKEAMCSGKLIADSTISKHIVEWLHATHSNS